jgi:hypothetical protein
MNQDFIYKVINFKTQPSAGGVCTAVRVFLMSSHQGAQIQSTEQWLRYSIIHRDGRIRLRYDI